MTGSPGTDEATQALRAGETGLGSTAFNIPTGATGRTASEMEARGPWSQARLRRGSLRHAHLLPRLGVTSAGVSQHASSHRSSICHDAPGKNTMKCCFFVPFITLTRLHLEALLALSGKTQPADSTGTLVCHGTRPRCESVGCGARGHRGLRRARHLAEEGPRGNVHPDSFTACAWSHKNHIIMMSRGLPGRRHSAGQGHLLWNPEPEISCFRIQGVVTLGLDLEGGVCPKATVPSPHQAVHRHWADSTTRE